MFGGVAVLLGNHGQPQSKPSFADYIFVSCGEGPSFVEFVSTCLWV